MKIGILSSGMETLALFSFLSRYDHEYLVYYDTLHAPYGEKYFQTSLKAVKEGVSWLLEQGAEVLILPPVYELFLLQDEYFQKEKKLILPLFQHYLLQEVFPHSLVGKIWLFGEAADLEVAQKLIIQLTKDYQATENQLQTKSFSFPFHFWSKECGILNPLLSRLSRKSLLTNTLLKHELRYFKDAHVDTVIPLNYLYFNAEKTIAKFFNFRKIRFHRLAKLEQIFLKLTAKKVNSDYAISIFPTDQKAFLLREKRMLRKLQRGKQVTINRLE